jgi:CTP-dependent riboflavin kinase
MEIIAEIISQGSFSVANWRNEGIRQFLEEKVPQLKGWYLGTINAKVISPQGLYIKGINTDKTIEVDVPPILYLKYSNSYKSEREGCIVSGVQVEYPAETMKLVAVKFKIESKMDETDGFLYIPSGSPNPGNGIVELIAKEKLRQEFRISDRDKIIINL